MMEELFCACGAKRPSKRHKYCDTCRRAIRSKNRNRPGYFTEYRARPEVRERECARERKRTAERAKTDAWKEYHRAYYHRPEVKAKVLAKQRERMQTPEGKAKSREYSSNAYWRDPDKSRDYQADWRKDRWQNDPEWRERQIEANNASRRKRIEAAILSDIATLTEMIDEV